MFLVKLESSFTWFRKLRATFHNCGIISGILEAVMFSKGQCA